PVSGQGVNVTTSYVTDDVVKLAPLSPRSPGSGHGPVHGLSGMRERAQLCAWDLQAWPLPAGGFRVLARLPVPALAAPGPAAPAPGPAVQSAASLELAR